MHKTAVAVWILSLVGFASTAIATSDLDKLYRIRNIIGVEVDTDRQSVNGEAVENEIVRYLRTQTRFAFVDEAYVQLKDIIKSQEATAFKYGAGSERVRQLLPQLRQMANAGVDAVVFTSIDDLGEKYALDFTIINASNSEILASTRIDLEDPSKLANFTAAAQTGITDLVRQLPFDGTILSREGYRVVIDLGRADLRVGMEIPAFTVERRENKPNLVETGTIRLLKVEDNLSFGRIVVDNKPAEVASLNKVLLSYRPYFRSQSEAAGKARSSPPRQYGLVDAKLGLSSLSLSQTSGGGAAPVSSSAIFPSLELGSEIWFNSRVYLEILFNGGLTSNVSDFRFAVGNRWPVFGSLGLPYVNLKAGYASSQFTLDSTTTTFEYAKASFSGIYLNLGFWVPFNEHFGMGIDLANFFFAGFSGTGIGNEKSSGASASDVVLKASYVLGPSLNFDVRLKFFGAGVDFETQYPGFSNSKLAEGVTTFIAGATYYF